MFVILQNMVQRRIPRRAGDEVTRKERFYLTRSFPPYNTHQTLLREFSSVG
jgi:hypothetical protein